VRERCQRHFVGCDRSVRVGLLATWRGRRPITPRGEHGARVVQEQGVAAAPEQLEDESTALRRWTRTPPLADDPEHTIAGSGRDRQHVQPFHPAPWPRPRRGTKDPAAKYIERCCVAVAPSGDR